MSSPFASKFIRILQTFDAGELKSFDRWLQSPWCNTNKNLPRLLACLAPYHPDFSNLKLTKEKLFYQVLPKGKYSDRRMNNLLSEGYQAAEKFLVFQHFSEDQAMQKDFLTKAFQYRYLDEWFFKETAREIDRLEEKPVKTWEDHVSLYRLHRRIYQHPHQGPRMQAGHETVIRMNEQIDLRYLLEKAGLINEMIFRNRIFKGENHDVKMELQKWNAASKGIGHPALDLYRMRFAYTGKDILPQYLQLRAAFLKRFDALSARQQKTHLLSLLNDTAQLIKSGQLDMADSLELYQLGLESGAVLNKGRLTVNTFTAIVSAGNTKGDFAFTKYFIGNYAARLDEKISQDCATWAWAHTAYWQKKLETCLSILLEYNFKTLHFQLLGRVLHTQAYFDLYLQDTSYQSYLFSFFDTFEKWLNREKTLSKVNKTAFLNFVQTCRKLARYYGDDDAEPGKIDQLLDQETNIQALNWLRQKQVELLQLKQNTAP